MLINNKKINKGYCYTACQSDCNKQTKHIFLGSVKIDGLLLACFDCVLTSKQQEYVNNLNNSNNRGF